MNLVGIIVAIVVAVVGVVIVVALTRVVVITRGWPVVTVWSIDVAPFVTNGQRMLTHVIVCVEVDVRDIVGGVADEIVAAIVNDEKVV